MATRITIGPPGTKLDWDNWGEPVTDVLNEHDDRLSIVEIQQVASQLAYTTNGVMATSTVLGTEVAMTGWTGGASPTFNFKAGWVHELILQCGAADTGTAGSAGRPIIKMRKGLNTIVGQVLGTAYIATIGGDQVVTGLTSRYVKNATAADIGTQIGLTVTKSVGGNAKIYGDVDIPLTLTMKPLGLITALTNHAAIAISIT